MQKTPVTAFLDKNNYGVDVVSVASRDSTWLMPLSLWLGRSVPEQTIDKACHKHGFTTSRRQYEYKCFSEAREAHVYAWLVMCQCTVIVYIIQRPFNKCRHILFRRTLITISSREMIVVYVCMFYRTRIPIKPFWNVPLGWHGGWPLCKVVKHSSGLLT